jgi:hypothetical protein
MSIAATMPAVYFTPEDHAAADDWHKAKRPLGGQIQIEANSEIYPECAFVYPPFHDFATWVVYRNAAGVWADEYGDVDKVPQLYATMADALEAVWVAITEVIAAEQKAFIATIPETLIPPLWEP